MPDFNNKPLFVGDSVRVICLNDPKKAGYDNQQGQVVSTHPFGSGLLFEVRFEQRGLSNALFEGYELVKDQPVKKPWLDDNAD